MNGRRAIADRHPALSRWAIGELLLELDFQQPVKARPFKAAKFSHSHVSKARHGAPGTRRGFDEFFLSQV
jgi:hypothetical protein